jgi:hypothetical protein
MAVVFTLPTKGSYNKEEQALHDMGVVFTLQPKGSNNSIYQMATS